MDLKIRRATRDDAEFLAWVMLASSRSHVSRGIWDLIIGAGDAGCLDYLKRLALAGPRSLCHYESFLVAEADGRPAAALCVFKPSEGGWPLVSKAMANVQRARTEQVNKESVARLAKQKADKAAADAKASQDAAVAALTESKRKFDEQREEVNRLAGERDEAQAALQTAQLADARWSPPGAPASGDRWDPGAPGASGPSGPVGGRKWDGWDPTLPQVPSANVPGDPIAVINEVLGISATSTQVTAGMGRNFLQQLGILKPDDTGITNAPGRASRIPRVYGRQATEYVIRRGMSQLGVPYSWGGGNAAGPSRGIDSGADTTGFDCSGLVLYSFAGVGIRLPHYSGSQYNMGRKIPSALMRRGDVIFYGPGGSQHVTIYLGNGQMLEAPDVGLKVRVAPVRTSGMTPFVVRYIEW